MEWFELLFDPQRMLMFSAEVFRSVLSAYNRDMAWVVFGVAAAALVFIARLLIGGRLAAMPVYVCLAALWVWLGAVFHAGYYAPINLAAQWLAPLAIAQGLLLAGFAVRGARTARIGPASRANAGLAWLLAALLFGPAMVAAGLPWDAVGYFATTPHTLIMATGACLLLTDRPPWLYCLPAAALGVVDAATAALLGERAIGGALLALAATLALAPWRRRPRAGAR